MATSIHDMPNCSQVSQEACLQRHPHTLGQWILPLQKTYLHKSSYSLPGLGEEVKTRVETVGELTQSNAFKLDTIEESVKGIPFPIRQRHSCNGGCHKGMGMPLMVSSIESNLDTLLCINSPTVSPLIFTSSMSPARE